MLGSIETSVAFPFMAAFIKYYCQKHLISNQKQVIRLSILLNINVYF